MYDVETVKVKVAKSEDIPDGYIVKNKSDFVEGEDELYTEEAPKAAGVVSKAEGTGETTPEAAKAGAPVQPWAKQS